MPVSTTGWTALPTPRTAARDNGALASRCAVGATAAETAVGCVLVCVTGLPAADAAVVVSATTAPAARSTDRGLALRMIDPLVS
ncbi:hypothetical protein GCM10018783_49890 [Streptomyces griseosporeus]|nr:hypothetical protein GCM10018783_49890 [Streptomyces griseosporeus]